MNAASLSFGVVIGVPDILFRVHLFSSIHVFLFVLLPFAIPLFTYCEHPAYGSTITPVPVFVIDPDQRREFFIRQGYLCG
jgi:hypothetical protein